MRRSLSCLGLLATITAVAHATDYTFTLSNAQDPELQSMGIDQPYSETFTIDTSQIIAPSADNAFNCSNGSCFTVAGGNDGYLSVNRSGTINESSEIGATADETISFFTDSSEATPLTLFTGSSLDPVLTTGNFYADVYFSDQSFSPQGPISIVDPPSSSAVPEPSTLALLGTGALGLAASLRRRLA